MNEDKYLFFHDSGENKKSLERYDDIFNGIMSKIKKIDYDWLEFSKDYMKIRFSSDDNLPLNKLLQFYNRTVTIRCVFSEDKSFIHKKF